MSRRDPKLLLEDILESIDKVRRYTNGLDYNKFEQNSMVVDAVVRNLEIIGEAAKKLPDSVRSGIPDVPWQNIIGLRNRVVHEYFGVDLKIVWQIATRELSMLVPPVRRAIDVR